MKSKKTGRTAARPRRKAGVARRKQLALARSARGSQQEPMTVEDLIASAEQSEACRDSEVWEAA